MRFERAFEAADFGTLRHLFSPDAVVVRTALSSDGTAEQFHYPATQWTDDAEASHQALRDTHLEILDTAVVHHPWGAVVDVRSRFRGRAGKQSFLSDGIDSYSMVQAGGAWRIVQYGYLERFSMPAPPAAAAATHAACPPATSGTSGAAGGPLAVAISFLHAFAKKDLGAVRGLFAPEAAVTTLDLAPDAANAANGAGTAPAAAYVSAADWSRSTEQQLAGVSFVGMDILDSSVHTFAEGAAVAVHFRATGRTPHGPFVAEGIDSYSLACQGNTWRIVRYGTFERLDIKPDDATPAKPSQPW